MLVLSRKKQERIRLMIPPSSEARAVWISPVKIKGDVTSLGIEAPPEIVVEREEVIGKGRGDRDSGRDEGGRAA